MEIIEQKKADEYYYCKKCKKEFTFHDCEMEGAPISGTYYVSPCCKKDIHWEDSIIEKERNVEIKKYVFIEELNKRLSSVMNVRNNEKAMRLMIIDIQMEIMQKR